MNGMTNSINCREFVKSFLPYTQLADSLNDFSDDKTFACMCRLTKQPCIVRLFRFPEHITDIGNLCSQSFENAVYHPSLCRITQSVINKEESTVMVVSEDASGQNFIRFVNIYKTHNNFEDCVIVIMSKLMDLVQRLHKNGQKFAKLAPENIFIVFENQQVVNVHVRRHLLGTESMKGLVNYPEKQFQNKNHVFLDLASIAYFALSGGLDLTKTTSISSSPTGEPIVLLPFAFQSNEILSEFITALMLENSYDFRHVVATAFMKSKLNSTSSSLDIEKDKTNGVEDDLEVKTSVGDDDDEIKTAVELDFNEIESETDKPKVEAESDVEYDVVSLKADSSESTSWEAVSNATEDASVGDIGLRAGVEEESDFMSADDDEEDVWSEEDDVDVIEDENDVKTAIDENGIEEDIKIAVDEDDDEVKTAVEAFADDEDQVDAGVFVAKIISDDVEYGFERREFLIERKAGFGFSINGGIDRDGPIKICKIGSRGDIAKDGRIKEGDIIIRIDDLDCSNVKHLEAVNALRSVEQFVRFVIKRVKVDVNIFDDDETTAAIEDDLDETTVSVKDDLEEIEPTIEEDDEFKITIEDDLVEAKTTIEDDDEIETIIDLTSAEADENLESLNSERCTKTAVDEDDETKAVFEDDSDEVKTAIESVTNFTGLPVEEGWELKEVILDNKDKTLGLAVKYDHESRLVHIAGVVISSVSYGKILAGDIILKVGDSFIQDVFANFRKTVMEAGRFVRFVITRKIVAEPEKNEVVVKPKTEEISYATDAFTSIVRKPFKSVTPRTCSFGYTIPHLKALFAYKPALSSNSGEIQIVDDCIVFKRDGFIVIVFFNIELTKIVQVQFDAGCGTKTFTRISKANSETHFALSAINCAVYEVLCKKILVEIRKPGNVEGLIVKVKGNNDIEYVFENDCYIIKNGVSFFIAKTFPTTFTGHGKITQKILQDSFEDIKRFIKIQQHVGSMGVQAIFNA